MTYLLDVLVAMCKITAELVVALIVPLKAIYGYAITAIFKISLTAPSPRAPQCGANNLNSKLKHLQDLKFVFLNRTLRENVCLDVKHFHSVENALVLNFLNFKCSQFPSGF